MFSGFLKKEEPEFPVLCLVVSGGHTLLLLINDYTDIKLLGTTIDDAAGEAFDKVSKMIGLGYPGGPKIQKIALQGDEKKIKFPVAVCKNKYDFSFSGLKTSVLRYMQENYSDLKNVPENDIPDIAASFQFALVKALSRKVKKALEEYDVKSVTIAGGVAANSRLVDELKVIVDKAGKEIIVPDMEFCGDNAAMIAYRGLKVYESGKRFSLEYNAFPGFNFADYGRKSKRGR
jgi:N6-L-threonylcarbamoyladenine synthase